MRTRSRAQDRLTAESRQMRQLLDDLCQGLEPWASFLGSFSFLDTIGADGGIPFPDDHSDPATQRRIRILRMVVDHAEQLGLDLKDGGGGSR